MARVAIDETAARRGHDYVTLFVDIDQARVVFATEGKDASTVAAFTGDLAAHGGDAAAVEEVCCIDMSPAFIKGTAEHLPNAAVTFYKLPAVKIVNAAVDQVRRVEQTRQTAARHTLYMAAQSGQTVGPPAGGTRRSAHVASQDGACLPDAAGLPGTLRPSPRPKRAQAS